MEDHTGMNHSKKRIGALLGALLLALGVGCEPARAWVGGSAGVWVTGKGKFRPEGFQGTQAGLDSALSYAYALGAATVSIFDGRISLTKKLQVLGGTITIAGASDSTVLQMTSTPGDTILSIYGAGATIRGITFDGGSPTATQGAGIAVHAPDVTIESCVIQNTPDDGIYVGPGGDRVRMNRNRIRQSGDAATGSGIGILLNGVNRAIIHDNMVDSSYAGGIRLQNTSETDVTDNRVRFVKSNTPTMPTGNTGGVAIQADSFCQYVRIARNRTERASTYGYEIAADSASVTDNQDFDAGSVGIHFSQVTGQRGCRLERNDIYRPYNYGIFAEALANAPNGVSIRFNRIFDAGVPGGVGVGIDLESNAMMNENSDISYNQVYRARFDGIRVKALGTGDYRALTVRGNTIYDAAGDGMAFDRTGGGITMTRLVVTDNVVRGAGAWGLFMSTLMDTLNGYVGGNVYEYCVSGDESIPANFQTIGIYPRFSSGVVTFTTFTQATLPAVQNGKVVYCSDCLKGSVPCAGAGTGALAVGIAGQWDCGP